MPVYRLTPWNSIWPPSSVSEKGERRFTRLKSSAKLTFDSPTRCPGTRRTGSAHGDSRGMDPALNQGRSSVERTEAGGSPTKRRRLDPQPVPTHQQPQGTQEAARSCTRDGDAAPLPLRAAPVHLTLWAAAAALRTSARTLLPLLAKRPSSTSRTSQERYSHTWSAYVQQTAGAIAALRAAVAVTAATSETKRTRTELRAQAMLAEALIDTYEGTEDEAKIAAEADAAITRAVRVFSFASGATRSGARKPHQFP